jgi:thiosulfate/3-mercaptopyruvate sulfurtransferase
MNKTITIILITTLVTLGGIAGDVEKKQNNPSSILVSTDWLNEHLNDSELIVLHVGQKESYDKNHIPGAQFVPIRELILSSEDGLKHEMPAIEIFKSVFESLGIKDDSKIVLYHDSGWMTVATRIFLYLDYLGFDKQISILDGGLPEWIAKNKPVSTDIPQIAPTNITLQLNKNLIVSKTWINQNLRNPDIIIIDGRPAEYYNGSEKSDHVEKYGHITGAFSLPFTDLLSNEETEKFKDINEIKEIFNSINVQKGSIVITYCNTGIWACAVYFYSKHLGYDVRFYDGGFEEWSEDENLSVTKPVNPEIFD